MKVALEAGEVLEVAVLDGERVVGTLSLQLKGLSSGGRGVGRPAGSTSERAASPSAAESASGAGRRRKRKPLSPETKAKMAEAQRRRWEKSRGNEGTTES
jgi:hypothetical protein